MDLMKAMALPAIKTYIYAHVQFCLQFEGFISLLKIICGSLWRNFLKLGPRPEFLNQNLEEWDPGICIFISSLSESLETLKSETVQLSVHRFPFKNVCPNERK